MNYSPFSCFISAVSAVFTSVRCNFHLPVIIALLSFAVAQSPADCDIVPSQYEFSMSLIATVQINGEPVADLNNQLAAYSNGECRGVVTPLDFNGTDIYFLMVYSNDSGGSDVLMFTFLDAASQQVISLEETLPFHPNDIIGSVVEPYTFHGMSGMPGDLNNDSIIDVLDIIQLVGIIMNVIEGTEYQLLVGDVNEDGFINVGDIVEVVGWIMSTE